MTKSRLRTILIAVAAAALPLLAWLAAMQWYNLASLPHLVHTRHGENGIWLSRRWMREPPAAMTEPEVREALAAFRRRGIRYLFPHCCPMDEEGHLPAINDETTLQLMHLAAEHGDFFRVMPWIGGSIATVDLSDARQRATWAHEVAQLVHRYGFAGVNVNIEPLAHGDTRVHDWLLALRSEIGTTGTISFCGMRPEDTPKPDDSLGIWTADDYEEIAEVADQITVMSYDSGRRLPVLFVNWSARQFVSVTNAVQKGSAGRCKILWGIPVYEDRADYFDPRVENLRTSLHGLAKGLQRTGENPAFQGVCIYSDWTIDAREWSDYDRSFGISR